MKLRLTFRSLVLATALSAPLTSATTNVDELVPSLGFEVVTVGTHRRDVTKRLGDPPDRFSSDVWVYWDYRDPRRAADEIYQTVVIIFIGDCVSRIRFTDTKATRAALAKFRRDQAITTMIHASVNPPRAGNKVTGGKSEAPQMLTAIREGRASVAGEGPEARKRVTSDERTRPDGE